MAADDDLPDGGFVSIMADFSRQLAAADRHGAAEGHDVDGLTVLESYDQAEHPWLHGRRAYDLAEQFASWWRSRRPGCD